MRGLLVVFLLVSSAVFPCHAKKGVPAIDVREHLNFLLLCNFSEIYAQFPDVLRTEGLEHLLLKIEDEEFFDAESKTSDSEDEAQSEEFLDQSDDSGIFYYPSGDSFMPVFDDTYPIVKKTPPKKKKITISPIQTPEALNEALRTEFMRRKKLAMTQDLGTALAPIGCDFGFNILAAHCGLLGPLGSGMAAVKMVANVVGVGRELIQSVFAIAGDEVNDPLSKYALMFVEKERFFPPSLRNRIISIFQTAYTDSKLKDVENELSILLSTPTHSKQPSKDFLKPTNKCIEGFCFEDDEMKRHVVRTVLGHYNHFDPKAGPNPKRKKILVLEGPAGVGKSHFVKMIAEALGLPFVKIFLGKGIHGVFGDSKNPGSFLEAIAKYKALPRNAILFFDEGDEALNGKNQAFWKDFFDPESDGVDLDWAKYRADWLSHACFIVACNHPIENKELRDRMRVVKLQAPSEEQKKMVLESKFSTQARSEDPDMCVRLKDLAPEIFDEIVANTDGQGFRPCLEELERSIEEEQLKRLEAYEANKYIQQSVEKHHEEDLYGRKSTFKHRHRTLTFAEADLAK